MHIVLYLLTCLVLFFYFFPHSLIISCFIETELTFYFNINLYYFAVCELVYDGAKGGPYDGKQAHLFLSMV